MTADRFLGPGKVRALTAASSSEGIFHILAFDHRDSLRAVLGPEQQDGFNSEDTTRLKLSLIEALGGQVSAVLLDPVYSVGQAVVHRSLSGHVGLLVALEEQGYLGDPMARQTTLLDGWSVAKAKRLGANGVKLLVLYHPDGGKATDRQDQLIASVISECLRHDIPLFLEPLAYSTKPEVLVGSAEFASMRRSIVIDTVKRLTALGPDVLKLQFPLDAKHDTDRALWEDACEELDETATVPWTLLSGGDPYDVFRDQVQIACSAGASGFIVGRALWRDYVKTHPEEQPKLIETVVRPNLSELTSIARENGRDWASKYSLPSINDSWYLTY